MSTKAKIGKDWVKCQVVLQETGETLHLTFAPGQTRKRITAHIDGRTDVGFIELAPLVGAAPPYDATLVLRMGDQGVRKSAPAAKEAKPVTPPVPAAVATAAAVHAPTVTPSAPKPVAVPEAAVTRSEEPAVTEVQDPAADATSAAGGKRGRKPAVQLPE